MRIESLDTLLYENLKDIYDAEKQLTKALPKMAKAASSQELQEALEEHLEVTQRQVERMEQVFEAIGQPAKSKTCKGMKGLIEEGKEVMDEDASDALLDANIIAAAQKVEHYEIAAYGTVREMAEVLGNDDAASLLQETLDEEKEADEKLTEVARSILQSNHAEMEEEEEQGMRMRAGRSAESSANQASMSGRRSANSQKKARRAS